MLQRVALAALCVASAARDIDIKASFAPENTLNEVKNGVQNILYLSITSHESTPYVLDLVTGSFRELTGKEKPLRNTTAAKYSVVLPPKAVQPVVVPYSFYSEFRPQELGLSVWADVSPQGEGAKSNRKREAKATSRLVAFDSQVSIVEPPVSWFDPKLIFSYLVALAALGGLIYWLFPTVKGWFVDPKKTPRSSKRSSSRAVAPAKKDISSPVKSVGPAYDPDFIPEHHLRKPRSNARLASAGSPKIPTGEPLSGSEAEGAVADASGTAAVGRTTRRRKQR